MKILVVDDSTINNILLQNLLEEKKFEVVTTLNGPDAIDILSKEQIELILLDVMMPEFSGFDFLNHLNKHKIEIPVIVITASADTDYKVRSLELGAKDFINKPIQFDELLEKIKKTVELV